MKKHFRALLINCSTGNEKEDKKHDNELRNLEGELEDSWDVGKCNLIRLSQKNENNIITCIMKVITVHFIYFQAYLHSNIRKKSEIGLTKPQGSVIIL